MQHKFKDRNPEEHEVFKALTVKNPYAHWISIGFKTWEIRSQPTKYRGKLIITSAKYPVLDGMSSGALSCEVDLVDCVMVKDLPSKDWERCSCLQKHELEKYKFAYAWILKNPRPVIELPVIGNLGIWNLVLDKDELIRYPQELFHYSKISKLDAMEKAMKRRGIRASLIMLGFVAAVVWLIYFWATS